MGADRLLYSFITQPNMYARGILFGKMKYELGDHAMVKCPELGLEADIEFKVKGWMGGTYNAIGGYIKDSKSGKNLYELSGYWTGEMYIKNLSVSRSATLRPLRLHPEVSLTPADRKEGAVVRRYTRPGNATKSTPTFGTG